MQRGRLRPPLFYSLILLQVWRQQLDGLNGPDLLLSAGSVKQGSKHKPCKRLQEDQQSARASEGSPDAPWMMEGQLLDRLHLDEWLFKITSKQNIRRLLV